MDNLLVIAVLLPFVTALLLLPLPAASATFFRRATVITTGVTLLLALALAVTFDRAAAGLQFYDSRPWLEILGISFALGLDGLSLPAFLLAALVAFAGALVSRDVRGREKEFYVLYLLLVSGALGAFASANLFFFYFFAEFEVLCAYLLIAGWGRLPGRPDGAERAALRMTLFVAAGAVLVLLGLLAIYSLGGGTFQLADLVAHARTHPLPAAAQKAIFLLLLGGFGILLSMWPLHSWAPPAYAAAPTAVSMFSAGVLKQLGAYGLLRIAIPLLPEGARACAPLLAGLGLVTILYGGWIALRQRDWKYLAAYASISHAGYLLLGLAALNVVGLTGVALTIYAGGLGTALLFACAGGIEARTGSREIAHASGLARRAPFLGVCTVMAAMAAVGLPGFAGFVGEILILAGAWLQGSAWMRAGAIAGVWGLVLAAVYLLRALRLGVYGAPAADAPAAEERPTHPAVRVALVLLLLATLAVGCWPRLLTSLIVPSVPCLPLVPSVPFVP